MTKPQPFTIPMNGKFITAEPASIGMNFRTLKNMRYTDTHLKGVGGMTKINSAAVMNATYLKTRNAFHFNKSQPQESHVIVQAYNAALSASQLLENTTAIPGTGSFSAAALWTDSSGAGRGYFADAPDSQMIYCNGVDSCIWGGLEAEMGAFILSKAALAAAGDVPSDPKNVTDKLTNTKTDAANVATVGGDYKTFLIGCNRPAQGATLFFSSVNATANTLTVKQSTATTWTTIAVTTDGTRVGASASFAQNGKISWASPVATTKTKYLEGYFLYWYEFTISDGSADLYHVTLDMPFQPIVDIWDGVYRDIARLFAQFTGSRLDYTTHCLKDDYEVSSPSTYGDISGLQTNTGYIEVGFPEKQTGLYCSIAPEFGNSSAAVCSIDYWNGAAYATAGSIADGTTEGGKSFKKTGVVSWNNADVALEQKKQYSNASALYYYRIKFDAQLSGSVRLNYVGGIPVAKTVDYYKFPVFAQGRVLLCADMSLDKNKVLCSSKFMPHVYNGLDSVDIYFGESGELTCGTELFSQFGSSLYSLILMFKDNETWIMAGQDINAWQDNTFLLSSSIGCPAPLSLKTINLASEPGVGVNRALAIWQGANGVFMSDGRAPIPIHGDIKEYFDKDDSRCIKASLIGESVGWVDAVNQEYHLLIASGSAATTLNTELVYDIHRNKWFEIDRTADLQCGLLVHDTDGNSYNYGFLDTGYMERLENGIPTVSGITLTHYADTKSTGTDVTMSPTRAGYRLAQPVNVNKLNADQFHSVKMVAATTGADFDGNAITYTVQTGDFPLADLMTETRISDAKLITVANDVTGFQPLALAGLFQPMSFRTDN